MPLITVFTPTYNRGYIIGNLYESLKRQSFTDFEWLIIDDGSTDNTKELFESWQQENNPFKIRYFLTQNGGKHRAINKGTDLALGKLFYIIDSDDYMTDDALEKICLWEKTVAGLTMFLGVSGSRGYSPNKLIGSVPGNTQFTDSTMYERPKKGVIGDKSEAFYTEILRKYKFPEFDGENFLTEAVVFLQLSADHYNIRSFNDIICICNYLPDGLTQNLSEFRRKNHQGCTYYAKQLLGYKWVSLPDKFRTLAGYAEHCPNVYQSSKAVGVNIIFFVSIRFFAKCLRLFVNIHRKRFYKK